MSEEGAWRARCCLGRALAFFFLTPPRCCLAWGGGPGVESWEERNTNGAGSCSPSQGPPGTVATVARCGHQVQLSGSREGFSSRNLLRSEAKTLKALI